MVAAPRASSRPCNSSVAPARASSVATPLPRPSVAPVTRIFCSAIGRMCGVAPGSTFEYGAGLEALGLVGVDLDRAAHDDVAAERHVTVHDEPLGFAQRR